MHQPRLDQPQSAPAATPRTGARDHAVLGAIASIVALGALLRWLAARGDLWLDEIWTLLLAERAGDVLGVLSGLHHDNNHYLTTAWALAVGPLPSPILFRLPALVASAATVLLVAWRPLRHGRVEAFASTFLVAGSYVLIHYGSEARGYAGAMFFAVAAFHALERHVQSGSRRAAAAYAAFAVLGLLSHLTFVFVLAGFVAWATVEVARSQRRGRPLDLASVALLVGPLGALVVLWAVDVRQLIVGGGPPWSLLEVLRELGRSVLGVPAGPLEIFSVLTVVAVGYAIWSLAAARDGRAVFFGVTLFVAPAAALSLRPPPVLEPRYLVVVVPFALMLCGVVLARIARSRPGRLAAGALLAAFALASATPISHLLSDGRGRYEEAVAFMAASTPEPVVTVTSDHEFRNWVVLRHHVERLGLGARFAYVATPDWSKLAPRWVLLHDFAQVTSPQPFVGAPGGHLYVFAASFPHGGLSGWTWLVYRRADGPGDGGPQR